MHEFVVGFYLGWLKVLFIECSKTTFIHSHSWLNGLDGLVEGDKLYIYSQVRKQILPISQ